MWSIIPSDVRANSAEPTLTGHIGGLSSMHGTNKRGIEELIEQLLRRVDGVGDDR